MFKYLNKNQLLRHNVIFFVGSILIGVLNYLYYPMLGRILSVGEFGDVVVLLALFSQIGVFVLVFGYVATHLSVNSEDVGKNQVLEDVYGVIFWIQIFNIIILIIFAPFLSRALQLASVFPILLLALNLYITLPYTLRTSVLQANKKFTLLSIGGLLQSSMKLLFSGLLIFLGAGVLGAIGGLLIAQLFALYFFSRQTTLRMQYVPIIKKVFNTRAWSESRYALLVFVAIGTVTMFSTFDTVVVKYFFPPEIAGEYSGISVIARMIFFATASIVAVLFSSITLQEEKAERYRLLLVSTFFVMIVGGIGLAMMLLFPEMIITIFLGTKYLPLASMLPHVALLMFLASFTNLFFVFFLSIRDYVLFLVAFCGIVILILLIVVMHGTIGMVIRDFIVANVIMLLLIFAYCAHDCPKIFSLRVE